LPPFFVGFIAPPKPVGLKTLTAKVPQSVCGPILKAATFFSGLLQNFRNVRRQHEYSKKKVNLRLG
jgi:hypothetical protein